jgi:hypothetical protein
MKDSIGKAELVPNRDAGLDRLPPSLVGQRDSVMGVPRTAVSDSSSR